MGRAERKRRRKEFTRNLLRSPVVSAAIAGIIRS